jgi:hypothetical protein
MFGFDMEDSDPSFMREPVVFIAATEFHVVIEVRSGNDMKKGVLMADEFIERGFVLAHEAIQLFLAEKLDAKQSMEDFSHSFMPKLLGIHTRDDT